MTVICPACQVQDHEKCDDKVERYEAKHKGRTVVRTRKRKRGVRLYRSCSCQHKTRVVIKESRLG